MKTVTIVKSKYELFRSPSCKNAIKYPLYKRTEDRKSQYMLYNDKMQPIYEVFKYIYIGLSSASEDAKAKQAQDLRLFYIFLQITEYDMHNLTEENLFDLIRFYGGDYKRFNYSLKYRVASKTALKDMFSQLTVINQISTCRRFLKFLKIECPPLQKENSKAIHSFISETLNGNIHHGQAIDSFITESEFKNLIDVITNNNDSESILIAKLMFNYKMELSDIEQIDINSLKVREQEYFIVINANHSASVHSQKGFVIDKDFYNTLYDYLKLNNKLNTNTFSKKLIVYYDKAGIKRDNLKRQNISSMLRRGCIYRIIFEHNCEITPQQLANILGVRNTTYLKHYIEKAKELSDEQ